MLGPYSRLRSSSFAIIFCAVTRVVAQGPGFESGNVGTDDYGPWDLTPSQFDSFLDHPNATTEYDLPQGKNISAPYSEKSIDGWTWSISVTADVPIENATDPNAAYFTGTRITINTPPSLPKSNSSRNLHVDKSWQTCIVKWRFGEGYNDKLREDDGSCSSVLSKNCVTDIEAAVLKDYNFRTGCKCPDVSKLSSCKDADFLIKNSCEGRWFNSTYMEQWPDGRFDALKYGGDSHAKGNMTAYNQTGSMAWPMVIMWGHSKFAPSGILNNTAKMLCIRAQNATIGSTVPGVVSAGMSSVHRSDAKIFSGIVSLPLLTALWAIGL